MGLLTSFHRGLIMRLLKVRYEQMRLPLPPTAQLEKEADAILAEVQKK